MKIALRWPECNADYAGPLPRPVVLDTNVVLDLFIFSDPLVLPLRALLAQGQLRWIANAAQRVELERVLHYSQIAPRVAFYGQTADGVLAAFDAGAQTVAAAPRIRYACTDPDDQHFLDLAAAHQAMLVSKDKAVLKLRKRMALLGATVGGQVLAPPGTMP
jgi:putative PIN family toxin of toxin-antitoxin system